MADWEIQGALATAAKCPNIVMKLGGLGRKTVGKDWLKREVPGWSEELGHRRPRLLDRRLASVMGGTGRKTLFMLETFTTSPDTQNGNGRIRTIELEVPGAGWP